MFLRNKYCVVTDKKINLQVDIYIFFITLHFEKV